MSAGFHSVTGDGKVIAPIRLNALEGEQTSLPCPIDMESRQAASAVWFHVPAGGSNLHDDPPRHLQMRKVYALEAPNLSSTTGALEAAAGLVDGSHWKQPSWSGRAFFSLLSDPPALLLNRLKREDSGSYVCNVTYRDSVTSYGPATVTESHIELFVAGDHDLTLTWYHDGGKLTTAHETVATSRGGWKSLVTLGPLRRGHLHSNLTCAAASDVSFPASVTVPVDMFLAPTAVTIWSWPLQKVNVSRSVEFTEASGLLSPPTRTKPFESGQAPVGAEVQNRAAPLASVEASLLPSASRSFECEASGSRPAANITWFLDGRPVEPAFSRSVTQGNVTTSMLFVPPTVQSARLLECRATNGNLPENLGVMSHFLKMDTSRE
ncbi:hypothetical protein V5799_018073 [Amblyomma americanum]|uniref:Ig-like domain-containing protein n=1 Tax=Amblyomma americanum TaxID=6943 RepID=A0AAQ4F0I0_AMBAM